MFSKSKVDSKPRKWQLLFCPVYALARPLAANKLFEKWKEKITPVIYLGMSPIHARTAALVLSLSTVRVSSQLNVAFDPSFTTNNGCNGNLFLLSYCQAICGITKGNKWMFVNSEKQDPPSAFISIPYQGHTAGTANHRGNPETG